MTWIRSSLRWEPTNKKQWSYENTCPAEISFQIFLYWCSSFSKQVHGKSRQVVQVSLWKLKMYLPHFSRLTSQPQSNGCRTKDVHITYQCMMETTLMERLGEDIYAYETPSIEKPTIVTSVRVGSTTRARTNEHTGTTSQYVSNEPICSSDIRPKFEADKRMQESILNSYTIFWRFSMTADSLCINVVLFVHCKWTLVWREVNIHFLYRFTYWNNFQLVPFICRLWDKSTDITRQCCKNIRLLAAVTASFRHFPKSLAFPYSVNTQPTTSDLCTLQWWREDATLLRHSTDRKGFQEAYSLIHHFAILQKTVESHCRNIKDSKPTIKHGVENEEGSVRQNFNKPLLYAPRLL